MIRTETNNNIYIQMIYDFIVNEILTYSVLKIDAKEMSFPPTALIDCLAYFSYYDDVVINKLIEISKHIHAKQSLLLILSRAKKKESAVGLINEIEKNILFDIESFIESLINLELNGMAKEFLLEYATSSDNKSKDRLKACVLLAKQEVGLTKAEEIILEIFDSDDFGIQDDYINAFHRMRGIKTDMNFQNKIDAVVSLFEAGFISTGCKKLIKILRAKSEGVNTPLGINWDKLINFLYQNDLIKESHLLESEVVDLINSTNMVPSTKIPVDEKVVFFDLLHHKHPHIIKTRIDKQFIEELSNYRNPERETDNEIKDYFPNHGDRILYSQSFLGDIALGREGAIEYTQNMALQNSRSSVRAGALYTIVNYGPFGLNVDEILKAYIKDSANPINLRLDAIGDLYIKYDSEEALELLKSVSNEPPISGLDSAFISFFETVIYLSNNSFNKAKLKMSAALAKLNELEITSYGVSEYPMFFKKIFAAWENGGKLTDLFEIIEVNQGFTTNEFLDNFSERVFSNTNNFDLIPKIIESKEIEYNNKFRMLTKALDVFSDKQ